jgi:hypothetical protein
MNILTVQTPETDIVTVPLKLGIEIVCNDKPSSNMLHFTTKFCT